MSKNKKIIKLASIFIIIIVIFLVLVKIITLINEKNIKKYITDNNFKKEEYNIYTVTEENNNIKVIKKILFDNNIFTKCLIETKDNKTLKINYYYTKDKEIIIEYENSYTDENGFKMESTKSIFKNDKLIECNKIIGNFSCDKLKEYKTNYENEIEQIIKNYNLNIDILKKINLK